jgi:hypothetical protein
LCQSVYKFMCILFSLLLFLMIRINPTSFSAVACHKHVSVMIMALVLDGCLTLYRFLSNPFRGGLISRSRSCEILTRSTAGICWELINAVINSAHIQSFKWKTIGLGSKDGRSTKERGSEIFRMTRQIMRIYDRMHRIGSIRIDIIF